MAWISPRAWVVGEAVTAAKLNEISSSLSDLDRRTSPSVGAVDTLQSTTSPTFTDLATAGPAATATIGNVGKALIAMWCRQFNSITPQVSLMGMALSGATFVGATDGLALTFTSPSNNGDIRHGGTYILSALNPGSTTATAKYRATSDTASFEHRRLSLTPLGS